MKNIILILILLLGVTSCYPPRIVYALDNECSLNNSDSIGVRLLKGSTTTIDAQSINTFLLLEIENKSNSVFTINTNNHLEVLIDSIMLQYEMIDNDSLPCNIVPCAKKSVLFVFNTKDSKGLIYGKKKNHLLKLHLDSKQNRITPPIILKPIKTRRVVYEKET